ncbi:MAG: TlpA disulfide reductase family protein [Bacteroidales bacterium]
MVEFGDIKKGRAFLYDTKTFTTDTLPIRNGSLVVRKTIASPGVFNLWIDGIQEYPRSFHLVLSSDPTVVSFDRLIPIRETASIYDIYPNRPSFRRDPNRNEAFYAYQGDWLGFYDTIMRLSPTDFTRDTLLEERKAVVLRFRAKAEERVAENRERLVSALILEHLHRENLLPLETLQQLSDGLGSDVKQDLFLDPIKLEAGFRPGTAAPYFELIDSQGKSHSLEDYIGSKILLHFWSSTCAPCIQEAPTLLALQKGAPDLKILNVSLDTDKTRLLKGIERAGFDDMVNVCDFLGQESRMVQDYGIRWIPACYLIDESGKIVAKGELSKILGYF